MDFTARWAEVERLIADEKLEEASKKVEVLLAEARAAGDEEEWTRALVRAAQLRIGLREVEGAVRFLQEEPWPQGTVHRAVLDLFLAHSLTNYVRVYGWEISQRERVDSGSAVDLKRWTREQIADAALAAYREVWSYREELGETPVSRLAFYLAPNDYPERIRGTLRDVVSYLLVELLADSSLWPPRQSQETYRLDLPGLIRGGGDASSEEVLASPDSHPLVKLAAVLSDLEAWHQAAGRREAALEARLERLRRLHSAFTEEEDRRLIRRDLEESLAAVRDLPWWSMGMAMLAEFLQQADDPGRLARAHEAALAGAAAWPDSPGGLRCQSIARRIEAPGFQLTAMTSDGLHRRSIQVVHKNLPALYFRAFPLDLRTQAGKSGVGVSLGQLREFLRASRPVATWRTELPETPDFESHTTWVVPPIDRPGAYVVLASPREDFAVEGNRIETLRLLLGDLVLVVRNNDVRKGLDVLALSGATGEPVAGVEVRRYWNSSGVLHWETKTSGADGAVRFPSGKERNQSFLLGWKGEDLALVENLYGWNPFQESKEERSTLLYTDRAVYRPQQKVLWKVLAFVGRQREGRYQAATGEAVTVALYDPNGQKVAEQTVTTNEFGTASGEFPLPPGHPLGTWVLGSQVKGRNANSAYVQVEEYKRPTFEVSLEDPAEPLRLNRPAKLAGKALYYFGLPVTGGEVRWRVIRQPLYPRWWWYGDAPASGSPVIASGNAALSPEGTFEVAFNPKADERLGEGLTYSFQVSAEVTDEGGETREAERSVRLGLVSVEAQIADDPAFLLAGKPASLAVVRRDLNGAPRPGSGEWVLYELRQPERTLLPADLPVPAPPRSGYRTPGDELSPRWSTDASTEWVLRGWEDGRRLAGGRLDHAATGQAVVPLPALAPGAYRLRYETVDDFGARVEAQRELIVAGPQTPLALPAVLQVETPKVRVGETARLLVHSGIPGQTLFFEIDRDGKPIERRTLRAGESPSLVEIPIRKEDRGGLGFRLLMLHDHQLLVLSAAVAVPWDDRELQVRFSSFRDKVRPGSRETWRVTVQGSKGSAPEAVAAELLASMTDRSLDLFAPYSPPSPLSLYPQDRSWTPSVDSGLGYQNAFSPIRSSWGEVAPVPGLRPDRLRFFDEFAIGGRGRDRVQFGDLQEVDGAIAQTVTVTATEETLLDSRRIAMASMVVTPGEVDRLLPPAEPPPAPVLRSRFDETAFWFPHLLTGPDGTATLEFTVPDAVTSWNVWVHALSRDFRAGSVQKEALSARDLLVRPYLPRFLREGDQAELKVVVNNATQEEVRGEVVLDVLDPETDASLLAEFGLAPGSARLPFTAAANGGTSVTFPLTAPRRVGTVAFKVTATAGTLSDGELRPLPLLPARIQLAQSRSAMLQGRDRRVLRFEDLERKNDPTRIDEQMVVTLDAQLFAGVLAALPYLVNYPYECTEQTLNRFLSTGIVASLFDRYPAVAKLAADLAKRDTPLEVWDAADPNRKLALEETPFLQAAQGGESRDLVKVLDPRIARAERDTSLAKLAKAQLPSGAFPWWPGGPSSPYMTVYILHGFAKAAEFGVEVPREPASKAWKYLARYYRDTYGERPAEDECCWRLLTFLNYVASAYTDPYWSGDVLTEEERQRILDVSFRHWREHSPYLKALLALTLKRMGRTDDARLVFDSVMDSAKTTPDEGTFWQPEERSWLWYNDTIETHAFILRALMELRPDDPHRHGLVQWLFLHKQLNHWKSTRATAEVLYALVHYLQREGQLGVREAATVQAGGRTTTFVFEPDRYTGKENRIVIPGRELDPSRSAVVVEKETPGFLFAAATWHFSTEELPQEDRGDLFQVSRRYFLRVRNGAETVLRPLAEGTLLAPGDEVEVQLSLRSRVPAEYVHLRDPRPAGLEPGAARSGWRWDLGLAWYEETRDSGTNFFFESLPTGEYTFKVRLHANLAGTFRAGPATVQSMYAPEFTAYSAGDVVRIEGEPRR